MASLRPPEREMSKADLKGGHSDIPIPIPTSPGPRDLLAVTVGGRKREADAPKVTAPLRACAAGEGLLHALSGPRPFRRAQRIIPTFRSHRGFHATSRLHALYGCTDPVMSLASLGISDGNMQCNMTQTRADLMHRAAADISNRKSCHRNRRTIGCFVSMGRASRIRPRTKHSGKAWFGSPVKSWFVQRLLVKQALVDRDATLFGTGWFKRANSRRSGVSYAWGRKVAIIKHGWWTSSPHQRDAQRRGDCVVNGDLSSN